MKTLIAVIVCVGIAILLYAAIALTFVWAVNTLFALNIAYNATTIGSAMVLLWILGAFTKGKS